MSNRLEAQWEDAIIAATVLAPNHYAVLSGPSLSFRAAGQRIPIK